MSFLFDITRKKSLSSHNNINKNCLDFDEHHKKKIAVLQTIRINEDLFDKLTNLEKIANQIFDKDIGVKEILQLLTINTQNLKMLFDFKNLNLEGFDCDMLVQNSLHLRKVVLSFIEKSENDIVSEKKKRNIFLINQFGEEISPELYIKYLDLSEDQSTSENDKLIYQQKITPIENFIDQENMIEQFIFPPDQKYIIKKYHQKQDRYDYCVYCMDNFTKDEDIFRTFCSHICHKICFEEWIALNDKCFFCMNSFI